MFIKTGTWSKSLALLSRLLTLCKTSDCFEMIRDGHLVAWSSWMFTDRAKADKFLDGTYKLRAEDWSSGNVLIFVDFVAPFGDARKLYRKCHIMFPKYPKAEWRRHAKSRRVGSNLKV